MNYEEKSILHTVGFYLGIYTACIIFFTILQLIILRRYLDYRYTVIISLLLLTIYLSIKKIIKKYATNITF